MPLFSVDNLVAARVALLRTQGFANQYDELLGWRLKDNMKFDGFTTGEFGVRMNSEHVRALPGNAILVVGDSFAQGSEVRDNETWPAQLERAVGQRVVNAAEGGWGTDQIVLRAEALAPLLQPNTVVVSYLDQDIMRARFRIWSGGAKPWFSVEDHNLKLNNVPVPVYSGGAGDVGWVRTILSRSQLVGLAIDRLSRSRWSGFWGPWWQRDNGSAPVENDPSEVSCLLLKRLKAEMDQRGSRLIFVLQYGGDAIVDWDEQPEYVNRMLDCVGNAVETINTWLPLRQVLSRGGEAALREHYVMHGVLYGHMSPHGNAFIADLIARTLREPPALTSSSAAAATSPAH